MIKNLVAFFFIILAASARAAPLDFVKLEEIPFVGGLIGGHTQESGEVAAAVASSTSAGSVGASGATAASRVNAAAARLPDIPAALLREWQQRTDQFGDFVQNGVAQKDAFLNDLINRQAAFRDHLTDDVAARSGMLADMERPGILGRLPIPIIGGGMGAARAGEPGEAGTGLGIRDTLPRTGLLEPQTWTQALSEGPEIFQNLMAGNTGALRSIISGRLGAAEERREGRQGAINSLRSGARDAYADFVADKAAMMNMLAARAAQLEGVTDSTAEEALASLKEYANQFIEATGLLRGSEPDASAWEIAGMWPPSSALKDRIEELSALQPNLKGLFNHFTNPGAAPAFATLHQLFQDISAGGAGAIQSVEGLDSLVKPFRAFGEPRDVELAVAHACLAFLDTVFPASA